jgi:hypothetical protein
MLLSMYRARRKLLGCLQSVSLFVRNQPELTVAEIWFMGYIIYLRMSTSPTVALARQIGKLRMDTRAKFRDVFSNGTTVSFMYKWLDQLPIEKPGPNQQVAAQEWENQDIPGSTSTGMARKRKADQNEEAADPDYRDSAPSSRNGSRSTAPIPKTRKTAESSTTRPAIVRPAAPAPPPSARPPPSAMDAAPGPYPPVYGGVSPYAVSNPNPYDQRAQQVSIFYRREKYTDNPAIKQ